MLSRFHLIPECYEWTDGRTDRFAISISHVSMLTRDKNAKLSAVTMALHHGQMRMTCGDKLQSLAEVK